MSDYKVVNGKKVRACKYTCGQMLAWDNTNNYYIEVDHNNEHHTPDRCKAFKEISKDPDKKQAVDTMKEIENNQNNKQNHTQITWEMVKKKLESIGIIINVERLMNQE